MNTEEFLIYVMAISILLENSVTKVSCGVTHQISSSLSGSWHNQSKNVEPGLAHFQSMELLETIFDPEGKIYTIPCEKLVTDSSVH